MTDFNDNSSVPGLISCRPILAEECFSAPRRRSRAAAMTGLSSRRRALRERIPSDYHSASPFPIAGRNPTEHIIAGYKGAHGCLGGSLTIVDS